MLLSMEDRARGESIATPGKEFSTAEFRRLYDSVFPILFRVAYRIANSEEAAEDLCQEAFFRLYEKNMVFPNPEEAKYWLIRVVKNASLNYAKRKDRERKAYRRAFREDVRTGETGEGLFIKKETQTEIQEALEKLPENLRMVLILKEYGELNYKEIGRALGISEGNVKVRVFRARERLSGLLKADIGPVPAVSFSKDGSYDVS
ncbi:RNA polymerase subunit sigma-24 [Spirochaetia bacterium]|nr:RNA polymerase subunit sigma-24 [Spirochaetia bacterium]